MKRKAVKGKNKLVPTDTATPPYKKSILPVKGANANLPPMQPPITYNRSNVASNQALGLSNIPIPTVEEDGMMAQKMIHQDELLADGEEMTSAHLKEQMLKMASANHQVKNFSEGARGYEPLGAEVTVGDVLVLKMFYQSSLLSGVNMLTKKVSKGGKDDQRITTLEDPMIFASDDIPFLIGALEKMLARKRLWKYGKAAGWNSTKLEQSIAELEGVVPPNTKMEEILRYYGTPSEMPTHATRNKVFPVSAYLSYSSIFMPGGWAHFVLQRIMYPWRRPSITIKNDLKLARGGDGYKDIKNPGADEKERWLFCGSKDENYVKIPLEELEGLITGLQNLSAQLMAKIAFSFANAEIPMYMMLSMLWEGVLTILTNGGGNPSTVLEVKHRFQQFSSHQVRRICIDLIFLANEIAKSCINQYSPSFS